MVKSWLNTSALTMPCSALASWKRIMSASRPPTMKKANAVTPYSIPIFLWSTVEIQLQMPVGLVGLLNTPAMVAICSLRCSSPRRLAG